MHHKFTIEFCAWMRAWARTAAQLKNFRFSEVQVRRQLGIWCRPDEGAAWRSVLRLNNRPSCTKVDFPL